MDRTPLLSYEGMKQKGTPSIYYLNILGIPFIIGILYSILTTNETDCNNLRLWLYVELIIQVVFTVASICQISKRFISKSNVLVKLPLLLLSLFQLTWLVIGSLWIFANGGCFDSFPEGFVMVSAISLITYATILVFLVLYLITCIVEARKKKH